MKPKSREMHRGNETETTTQRENIRRNAEMKRSKKAQYLQKGPARLIDRGSTAEKTEMGGLTKAEISHYVSIAWKSCCLD